MGEGEGKDEMKGKEVNFEGKMGKEELFFCHESLIFPIIKLNQFF